MTRIGQATSDVLHQFQCGRCKLYYRTAGVRNKHLDTAHEGPKQIVCDVEGCGSTFTSQLKLKHHKYQQHDNLIQCTYCPEKIAKPQYARHVNRHERPFYCSNESCEKRFAAQHQLDEHVAVQHEGKRYTCENCGEKYTTSNGLKAHSCVRRQGLVPFIPGLVEGSIATKVTSKKRKAESVDEEDEDESDEVADLGHDEERGTVSTWLEPYLLNGFDGTLHAAIEARNAAFCGHHADLEVTEAHQVMKVYDAERGVYVARAIGTCAGVNGDQCPYTTQLTDSNSLLATGKRNVGGKVWVSAIIQAIRCYLCQQVKEKKSRETLALREMAGKCVAASSCENEVPAGERLCSEHRAKLRDGRIRREVEKSADDKGLRPSCEDVLDELSATPANPAINVMWHIARVLVKVGGKVYTIDTEWVNLRGKRLLTQVAMVDVYGTTVLDATVDYEMTLTEMLQRFELPKNPHAATMSRRGLAKFYAPGAEAATTMMTLEQIACKLRGLELRDSVLIEHSTGFCDYTLLQQEFDKDLLPPKSQVLSSIYLLKRYALRSMPSYALAALYPCFCPDSRLIFQHHIAVIDTIKLSEVMKMVFENAKSFQKSESIVDA